MNSTELLPFWGSWGHSGWHPDSQNPCEICGERARGYLNPGDDNPRWFCYEHFITTDNTGEWLDLTILAMRAEYEQ